MNQAEAKRWSRYLGLSTVLYVGSVFGAVGWLGSEGVVPDWVIAVLPLPGVVLMTYSSVRRFLVQDELEQRIQVDGLAFGFVGGGLIIITVGLLQASGMRQLNWIWAWAALGLCWLVGTLVGRRRYR